MNVDSELTVARQRTGIGICGTCVGGSLDTMLRNGDVPRAGTEVAIKPATKSKAAGITAGVDVWQR